MLRCCCALCHLYRMKIFLLAILIYLSLCSTDQLIKCRSLKIKSEIKYQPKCQAMNSDCTKVFFIIFLFQTSSRNNDSCFLNVGVNMQRVYDCRPTFLNSTSEKYSVIRSENFSFAGV